jgi:lipopolysaccharide transport system permease protein
MRGSLDFSRNVRFFLDLTKREVGAKYKGGFIGLGWIVLTPLISLAIYTVVFSQIFKVRWPKPNPNEVTSLTEFGLILMVGLGVFQAFSETLGRAPTLITSQPGYVKKVQFPLMFLPISTVAALFVNVIVTLLIVLLAHLVLGGSVSLVLLAAPGMLLMYFIFVTGLSLLFSSLGVFLRDLGSILGFVATALMFLSPIFFPSSAIPKSWSFISDFNPLTFYIEGFRGLLLMGTSPSLSAWFNALVVAIVVFFCGYSCFRGLRRGFADVL